MLRHPLGFYQSGGGGGTIAIDADLAVGRVVTVVVQTPTVAVVPSTAVVAVVRPDRFVAVEDG